MRVEFLRDNFNIKFILQVRKRVIIVCKPRVAHANRLAHLQVPFHKIVNYLLFTASCVLGPVLKSHLVFSSTIGAAVETLFGRRRMIMNILFNVGLIKIVSSHNRRSCHFPNFELNIAGNCGTAKNVYV